jgi:hypothetical protein
MVFSILQALLVSLTMWSCGSNNQTETSLDTVGATTTPPNEAIVVLFSTSEVEMVTERLLTVELDGQTLVTVECTADILLGDFEEKHKIISSSPAVTHNLYLNGLLPETAYSCTTIGAAQNVITDFTTGSLPPSLTSRYHTPTGTPPAGYMLFNTDLLLESDHWLVIQDYSGNVRWYLSTIAESIAIALEHEPTAGGIVVGGGSRGGLSFLPPSVYDISGTLIKQLENNSDHDIDYRNENFYSPFSAGDSSCIQRWSFDTLKQSWEWCSSEEDSYDINSIDVSEDESLVLMTTYLPMEGIVKVDIESGNKEWNLHPDGSGDLSVNTPIRGLGLQHDISLVDCKDSHYDLCFVVYDNGTQERGYSQILNYGIDEAKMTATLLRSFTRDGWFETHSGGVHQMSNREWLISISSITDKSLTSYLIVDVDGNELWEMTSTSTDVAGYRARHIDPCDIFNHTGMCPE